MSDKEEQKTVLAVNTIHDFFRQFGNDIYSEILLEELFKGLINEEALFVFGKQKQTGDQSHHNPSEQGVCEQRDIRHDGSQSSDGMGEEDRTDYP